MYLSIVDVKPLEKYRLLLKFENGEERIFDVAPFLELGQYSELKDIGLFKSVKPSFDSIQWANKLDFDPEFLHEKSLLVQKSVE